MNHRTAFTHVVVLGGGYAGTMAANHLRVRDDVTVTLVNPRPHFVERIRLHQLVAGTRDATVDYGELLGHGIDLVVDRATHIDVGARVVELEHGSPLTYDYLVYAVGSTAAVPASVTGAQEHAHPVAELEHAIRLKDALDGIETDAPITVVGAGLTGIETASELAEQGRHVTLACGGRLGPYLSESGRRSVAKVLRDLGVEVLDDGVVTEVRSDSVVYADASVRPSAVTIWAAGFGMPGLAAVSGLRTDQAGRLLTDETLTSVDDDRVIAAGDCASPSGAPLRMSCQAAGPLGTTAAATILSRLDGAEPAVIDQAFFGACISLGRKAAILQPSHLDDRPVTFSLTGRAIAPIKELACTSPLWLLRREARRPGAAFWFTGGSRPDGRIPASDDDSLAAPDR